MAQLEALDKYIERRVRRNVAHRPFLLFATLFGESRFPPPLRGLIPLARETLSKSDQVVNYRVAGLEATRIGEYWTEFEHYQFEHRFGEFSCSVAFARRLSTQPPHKAEGRITLKRDRRSITPDSKMASLDVYFTDYKPYLRMSFDNDQQLGIWVNEHDISTVQNLASPPEHPLTHQYSSERVDPESDQPRWVPHFRDKAFQLIAPYHQIGTRTIAFVEQNIQEAVAQFLGERNDQLNNLPTEGLVIERRVFE